MILTAWGVFMVHSVDNLLGQVLVGTTLRVHTFVIFWQAAVVCRVYQTLRTTPAMAAGLMDHVWTLSELLTNDFTSSEC